MRRVLVWIGGASAVLAVAMGVAWWIGSRLPVAHRAELSRPLEVPVDDVWRRIEDVGSWSEWRSDVDGVEVVGDQVRVTSRGEVVGYRVERPEPRVLVTEIVGEGLPYGGRWVWSVAPAAEGATVTIVEEGEVYPPLFRFVSRYVLGHDATIRGVLDQLESSFTSPDS